MIREGKGYLPKGTTAEWVELDGEKVLKLSGSATARFREHEQLTMSDYRARLRG